MRKVCTTIATINTPILYFVAVLSVHRRPVHRQMQGTSQGPATSERGCHAGEGSMRGHQECRGVDKGQGVKGRPPSRADDRCASFDSGGESGMWILI